jgi:hypothetical protein
VYELTINQSGKVSYNGIANVKVKGQRFWNLSLRQIRDLKTAIDSINFMSIENIYVDGEKGCPIYGTDMPRAMITVNSNGKNNLVVHDYGCETCESMQASNSEFFNGYQLKLDGTECQEARFLSKLTRFEDSIDLISGANAYIGKSQEQP